MRADNYAPYLQHVCRGFSVRSKKREEETSLASPIDSVAAFVPRKAREDETKKGGNPDSASKETVPVLFDPVVADRRRADDAERGRGARTGPSHPGHRDPGHARQGGSEAPPSSLARQ